MVKYFIYLRVSSEQQRDNNRYNHQEKTLVERASKNGWEYEIHKEIRSGKDIAKRPIIKDLLHRLELGQADGIMVISVDRLTRNVQDATILLDKASREGWKIYVDNIYTNHKVGFRDAFLHEAVKAETEINMLSERTKEGLAQSTNKDRFGARKFPTYTDQMIHRIVYLRDRRKLSFIDIAKQLNKEGIPTARPEFSESPLWNMHKVRVAYHRHGTENKILSRV